MTYINSRAVLIPMWIERIKVFRESLEPILPMFKQYDDLVVKVSRLQGELKHLETATHLTSAEIRHYSSYFEEYENLEDMVLATPKDASKLVAHCIASTLQAAVRLSRKMSAGVVPIVDFVESCEFSKYLNTSRVLTTLDTDNTSGHLVADSAKIKAGDLKVDGYDVLVQYFGHEETDDYQERAVAMYSCGVMTMIQTRLDHLRTAWENCPMHSYYVNGSSNCFHNGSYYKAAKELYLLLKIYA